MHTLRKQDRDAPMTHTVSFHGVPMFRGLAFAIDHIEHHGAPVSIFSADRRDSVIREHNKQFGTNLHSQQYAIDHQGQPGWSAANPVDQTSPCLRSDGNPVYRDSRGRVIPKRGKLPWYELGIDLVDKGTHEDVRRFLAVAHKLGYHFVNPYSSGSEKHHVVCVLSPIPTLEAWNQISKERQS
jgi:hypothetical protein